MFVFDTDEEEDEFGQDGWLAGGYKLVVALLVAERCQLKTFTAPPPHSLSYMLRSNCLCFSGECLLARPPSSAK